MENKTKNALLNPKRGTMFSEMLSYWLCVIHLTISPSTTNYADGIDGRVFDHFNEWNNFDTKKEVLDALYSFDKEITKTK